MSYVAGPAAVPGVLPLQEGSALVQVTGKKSEQGCVCLSHSGQSRSPIHVQFMKFLEVKKAVLIGQGGFLPRQPGSSCVDWMV